MRALILCQRTQKAGIDHPPPDGFFNLSGEVEAFLNDRDEDIDRVHRRLREFFPGRRNGNLISFKIDASGSLL
jgi:hypothetical protein